MKSMEYLKREFEFTSDHTTLLLNVEKTIGALMTLANVIILLTSVMAKTGVDAYKFVKNDVIPVSIYIWTHLQPERDKASMALSTVKRNLGF